MWEIYFTYEAARIRAEEIKDGFASFYYIAQITDASRPDLVERFLGKYILILER